MQNSYTSSMQCQKRTHWYVCVCVCETPVSTIFNPWLCRPRFESSVFYSGGKKEKKKKTAFMGVFDVFDVGVVVS